jgi:hypothetical protein
MQLLAGEFAAAAAAADTAWTSSPSPNIRHEARVCQFLCQHGASDRSMCNTTDHAWPAYLKVAEGGHEDEVHHLAIDHRPVCCWCPMQRLGETCAAETDTNSLFQTLTSKWLGLAMRLRCTILPLIVGLL